MLLDVLRALSQDIYNTLSSGFNDVVYKKAFEVGLRFRSIPYEAQRVVPAFCEGFYIGEGRPDLIGGASVEKVVIELKKVEWVGHEEGTQIDNCLQVLEPHMGC